MSMLSALFFCAEWTIRQANSNKRNSCANFDGPRLFYILTCCKKMSLRPCKIQVELQRLHLVQIWFLLRYKNKQFSSRRNILNVFQYAWWSLFYQNVSYYYFTKKINLILKNYSCVTKQHTRYYCFRLGSYLTQITAVAQCSKMGRGNKTLDLWGILVQ